MIDIKANIIIRKVIKMNPKVKLQLTSTIKHKIITIYETKIKSFLLSEMVKMVKIVKMVLTWVFPKVKIVEIIS
jgi:hypothetical protein